MGKYLKGKENKEYKISDNLIEATYNPTTGLIVSTDNISGRYVATTPRQYAEFGRFILQR